MSQQPLPVTVVPAAPRIELRASEKFPDSYSFRVPEGYYVSVEITDGMRNAVSGGKKYMSINTGAYVNLWKSKYPPKK